MKIGIIKGRAKAFREAIERCDKAQLGVSFMHFPKGSCGDTSPLLGTYLSEIGAGRFQYVLGIRGEGRDRHTHAWLEGEGLIIDITADQFEDAPSAVIVTARSAWHDSFERQGQHDGDYRVFDPLTQLELGRMYELIVSHLQKP